MQYPDSFHEMIDPTLELGLGWSLLIGDDESGAWVFQEYWVIAFAIDNPGRPVVVSIGPVPGKLAIDWDEHPAGLVTPTGKLVVPGVHGHWPNRDSFINALKRRFDRCSMHMEPWIAPVQSTLR